MLDTPNNAHVSFCKFVAIKRREVPVHSTDYKAMSSFLASVYGSECVQVEDQLRVWIASMIDRGMAIATRRRYVGKLSSVFGVYCMETGLTAEPFGRIRELCNLEVRVNVNDIQSNLTRIESFFDILMSDAKDNANLALFLFLLFNLSSDVEKAIYLTSEDYTENIAHLKEIIKLDDFHHRRKYVFHLGQSRKRTPQLLRGWISEIVTYFRIRKVIFPDGFSAKTVLSLWIAKARKIGVGLSDIKALLPVIPHEYEYLKFIKGSELSAEDALKIKKRVADAFAPSGRRWYAIKLKRGVVFERVKTYLQEHFSDHYDAQTLFYPQKTISKKVDGKISAELVPVIPDVVFFNVLPRHVRGIDWLLRVGDLGRVFKMVNSVGSDFSIISRQSMLDFQRFIGIYTPEMKIVLTNEFPIGVGQNVRITGGIMAGYTGVIYNIKEQPEMRHIYIRLSSEYSIKTEVKVEECFVELLDKPSALG